MEEYSHVLLDLKPLKKDRQYLSREEQTEETLSDKIAFDALWDESPIDVTPEVNFIWSIANKLRGSYMPDKYGDVIIPMTILRRLECALEPHKRFWPNWQKIRTIRRRQCTAFPAISSITPRPIR